jgi:thiol-disulfide isomerase/thioredoxin
MVGDPAPPLEVTWYRPGDKEPRLPGQPYVVEFWSTWCGPCIANMPRLSELQEKYKGKLTIIGVSVWEPRPHEVWPFVQKQGDRMAYAVAADSVPPAPPDVDNPSDWAKQHGKASLAWLCASGWNWDGIPVSFIVDARDRIAWVGHPREMEEPLAAIVEGRWDLAAFQKAYATERVVSAKAREIYSRRRKAQQAHDHDTFLKCTDELLALGPHCALYSGSKFRYLLLDMKEPERAYTYARQAIAAGGAAHNNFDALNQIAATIVQDLPKPDALDLALAASTRAAELGAKDIYTLTTLAEIHAARGEFEKAAEVQRRAIAAAARGQRPELEAVLRDYEAKAERR